jgi:O-methyltransferase involved in polyketide biosynthesis
MEKDYSSISPSAKSLLIIKGLTNIPYAKEAAALMPQRNDSVLDTTSRDTAFWGRVTHFEIRYWSIDQLLAGTGITNILELSSGYSFRGLDMAMREQVHYIDTDLPDVIGLKQEFNNSLQQGALKGKLELLPLNAVDERAFEAVVEKFSDGPIAIVNEGLLMYLNNDEKEKLCANIHKALKQHGGYWITADVYVRRPEFNTAIMRNEREKQFFEQHNVEENKFESFEEAKAFFNQIGFEIVKEAEIEPAKLTALPKLLENADPEMIERMKAAGKMQATWMLKAI